MPPARGRGRRRLSRQRPGSHSRSLLRRRQPRSAESHGRRLGDAGRRLAALSQCHAPWYPPPCPGSVPATRSTARPGIPSACPDGTSSPMDELPSYPGRDSRRPLLSLVLSRGYVNDSAVARPRQLPGQVTHAPLSVPGRTPRARVLRPAPVTGATAADPSSSPIRQAPPRSRRRPGRPRTVSSHPGLRRTPKRPKWCPRGNR